MSWLLHALRAVYFNSDITNASVKLYCDLLCNFQTTGSAGNSTDLFPVKVTVQLWRESICC